MTPLESEFNDGMELATQNCHAGRSTYWGGYMAGLMRGLFGADGMSDRHHAACLDPAAQGDAAKGYRDGFRRLVELRALEGSSPVVASVTASRQRRGATARGVRSA